LPHRTPGASFDHPCQFHFQRTKLTQTFFNAIKVLTRYSISIVTWTIGMVGQIKKRSDVPEFKAQGTRMPHEHQAVDICI